MAWFAPSPCQTHKHIFFIGKVLLAYYLDLSLSLKHASRKSQQQQVKFCPQSNLEVDAQYPLCITNIFKIHSPQSLNYITSNYRLRNMQSVINKWGYLLLTLFMSHKYSSVHLSDKQRLEAFRIKITEWLCHFSGFMHTDTYTWLHIWRSKENQWVTWVNYNPLANEMALDAQLQDVMWL